MTPFETRRGHLRILWGAFESKMCFELKSCQRYGGKVYLSCKVIPKRFSSENLVMNINEERQTNTACLFGAIPWLQTFHRESLTWQFVLSFIPMRIEEGFIHLLITLRLE